MSACEDAGEPLDQPVALEPVEPADEPLTEPADATVDEPVDEGPTGSRVLDDIAPRDHHPPPTASLLRRTTEWVGLLMVALLVAFVLRSFVVQSFYIPSTSMVPTLKVGDRVLVNKLAYRFGDPHRGDVIVFEAPPGERAGPIKDLIKRVMGLPGETIEGRQGHVYIDGRLVEEPWLPAGVQSREFGPEKIPLGRYWVLGDNRFESRDSTFFKSIPRSLIVGKAFVKIWPLNDLGFL